MNNRTHFNLEDKYFVLISYLISIITLILNNNSLFTVALIFIVCFRNKKENTKYININLNNITKLLLIVIALSVLSMINIIFNWNFNIINGLNLYIIVRFLLYVCRQTILFLLIINCFKAYNNQTINMFKYK